MREHMKDDQALNNIAQAKRVMDMLPDQDFTRVKDALDCGEFDRALAALALMDLPNPNGLVPEPGVIIRAEIINAKRYWCIPLSS